VIELAALDLRTRALVRATRLIPPLPHATAIVNRLVKPVYMRRRRGRVVVPLDGSLVIEVDPAEALDGMLMFCPHLYERAERVYLTRLLRPGDTFLDCGAHIGFYTLHASARVGEGRVLSIEADPETHARLRANLERNGITNVVSVNVGVSDRDEDREFYRARGHHRSGSSFVKPSQDRITLRCRPLDRILIDHGIRRIRVAKLDIEGFESRVLRRFFAGAEPGLYPDYIMVEDIERYRPDGDLPVSRVLAEAGYTLARGFHRNFVYRRAGAAC
jgi:FkbM family methyltransferase